MAVLHAPFGGGALAAQSWMALGAEGSSGEGHGHRRFQHIDHTVADLVVGGGQDGVRGEVAAVLDCNAVHSRKHLHSSGRVGGGWAQGQQVAAGGTRIR